MCRRWRRLTLAALVLATNGCALRGRAFTDAVAAGSDAPVQGEYADDEGPRGAQVLARGGGRFELHLLEGGFPDQGPSHPLARLRGTAGDLRGQGWTAQVSDGVLSATDPAGRAFRLTRTTRSSSTLGAAPPPGAIVLFGGSSVDEWEGGRIVDGGLLSAGTTTRRRFRDFTLHLEFRLALMPWARGRGRSNSGVYLQDRYEVQVLDSFGLPAWDKGCGAVYGQAAPAANACRPPLVWQTYDVEFQAARFDARGRKTSQAHVTVRHNGVLVHDRRALDGPTAHGRRESDAPGPIHLQAHGAPVAYRNVWLREVGGPGSGRGGEGR